MDTDAICQLLVLAVTVLASVVSTCMTTTQPGAAATATATASFLQLALTYLHTQPATILKWICPQAGIVQI